MLDQERFGHDQAEQAASRLQAAALSRSLPDLPLQHRPRWQPFAASIVILSLVVGIVVAMRHESSPVVTNPTESTSWVIDDDGWTVSSITGPDITGGFDPRSVPQVALFGTSQAPAGPLLSIESEPPNGPSIYPASDPSVTNLRELQTGAGRLVLGDGTRGTQGWLEIGGSWVTVRARSMSDNDLVALAPFVEVGDGVPFIGPEHLPAGMRSVGRGSQFSIAPFAWTVASAVVQLDGVQVITHARTDGSDPTALAVAPASDADIATLGLHYPNLKPATIAGDTGWSTGPDATGRSLVIWQASETLFALLSNTQSIDQLTELANHVTAMPTKDIEVRTTATPAGTRPEAAADTIPAQEDAAADTTSPARADPPTTNEVEIQLDMSSPSDSELRIDGALPDGTTFAAAFAVVADTVRVNPVHGDLTGLGLSVRTLPLTGDEQLVNLQDAAAQPELTGWAAITEDPAAAYLEVVRTNGDVYRTELHATAAHPTVRLAAIFIPATQFIRATLKTTDGTVLANYGGS